MIQDTQHVKANIVVVDDTPENLRLLIKMLDDQGYRVWPAPNGTRALATIQKHRPDLVLLDIMMPEMDGFEVCRRLKADEHIRNIPVIFLSASNETLDKVKAFSIGGVDYITKPFQAEEVRYSYVDSTGHRLMIVSSSTGYHFGSFLGGTIVQYTMPPSSK